MTCYVAMFVEMIQKQQKGVFVKSVEKKLLPITEEHIFTNIKSNITTELSGVLNVRWSDWLLPGKVVDNG